MSSLLGCRACDAATLKQPSYRSIEREWNKEKYRIKLWMLHEAINWNFSEFSPSMISALSPFRAIYSLIVFLPSALAQLNTFNGSEACAQKLWSNFSTEQISMFTVLKQRAWKWLRGKNRNWRAFCAREISTMCNCPSDMASASLYLVYL